MYTKKANKIDLGAVKAKRFERKPLGKSYGKMQPMLIYSQAIKCWKVIV